LRWKGVFATIFVLGERRAEIGRVRVQGLSEREREVEAKNLVHQGIPSLFANSIKNSG